MAKYASAYTDTAKENGPVGGVGRGRRSGSHSIYEINRQGYETWGSLNDSGLPKTPTPSGWSDACSNFGRFTGPTPGPLPEHPSGPNVEGTPTVPEHPYAPMSTAPRHGHGSSAVRWTYGATGVSEKRFRPPRSVPAPAAAAPPRGGSIRAPPGPPGLGPRREGCGFSSPAPRSTRPGPTSKLLTTFTRDGAPHARTKALGWSARASQLDEPVTSSMIRS